MKLQRRPPVQRLILGWVFLLMIMIGVLLSATVSDVDAQVNCSESKREQLTINTIVYATSQRDALCYQLTVPRLTALVETAFSAYGGGAYDLLWGNGSEMILIASDLAASQSPYVITVMDYHPNTANKPYSLAVVPKSTTASDSYGIGVFAKDNRGSIRNPTAGASSGTGDLGSAPAGGRFISVRAHSTVYRRFSARCGIINIEANWQPGRVSVQDLQLILVNPSGQPVHTVPVGRATGPVFTITYPVSADQVKNRTTWTVKYVNLGSSGVSVYPRMNFVEGACPSPVERPTTMGFQHGRYPTSSYRAAGEAVLSQTRPTASDKSLGCLVDGDDPVGTGLDKTSLLYWDIAALPAGARVVDATITIDVFDRTGNTYYIYGMNRPWNSDLATWTTTGSGRNWQIAGAQGTGDRDLIVLGELQGAEVGSNVIRLNSNGRWLVQSWIDRTKPNHGFAFANADATDGVDFHCSDAPDPQRRPMLTVVYE